MQIQFVLVFLEVLLKEQDLFCRNFWKVQARAHNEFFIVTKARGLLGYKSFLFFLKFCLKNKICFAGIFGKFKRGLTWPFVYAELILSLFNGKRQPICAKQFQLYKGSFIKAQSTKLWILNNFWRFLASFGDSFIMNIIKERLVFAEISVTAKSCLNVKWPLNI